MNEIEFDRLMAAALAGDEVKQIAVAVSGGADSIALCLLAARWAETNHIPLTALTVDHALRPDSRTEANQVKDWLAARNIAHHILEWQGEKPEAGIQSAAREARYNLMNAWCEGNDIRHLLVAHHLEDQAETFIMRLERGSGVDGLACMPSSLQMQKIKLLRPLLSQPKEKMKEFLDSSGQQWIEDPSNSNPAYARTHLRQLVGALAETGVNAQRLGAIVVQFGQLKQLLHLPAQTYIDNCCRIEPEGYALFNQAILRQLPDPIISRVIVRLMAIISGEGYPPRKDRLARAVNQLKQDSVPGFTLGGCNFLGSGKVGEDHEIMICREEREKSRVEITAGDAFVWRNVFDMKFDSIGESSTDKVFLRPLGKSGWAKILKDRPDLRDISIPYQVRLTLPALFDHRGVFDAPLLGYRRDDAAFDSPPPPITFKMVRFTGVDDTPHGAI